MKWSTYVRVSSDEVHHIGDPERPAAADEEMIRQITRTRRRLDDFRATINFGDGWVGVQGVVESSSPMDAVNTLRNELGVALLVNGLSYGLVPLEIHAEPWDDSE